MVLGTSFYEHAAVFYLWQQLAIEQLIFSIAGYIKTVTEPKLAANTLILDTEKIEWNWYELNHSFV